MKLTVKTLKGEKFDVNVDDNQTILQVKGVIESQKAELVASTLKLIHSGKILKDDDVISACGIKDNDFLVVMVTKAKKPAAAGAAAATVPPKVDTTAAAATATTTEATTTATDGKPAAATTPTNATTDTTATDTNTTPAPTTSTTTAPGAPRRVDPFSDEAVSNLISMGFPEAEVRHCLQAANGNPDIAVEYLTNGIPDRISNRANLVDPSTSSTTTTSQPLQALRNHPQFDALRRLVQSNPGALQQVLTQIGQQQPDLLAEINANQATFLEMMNEPITSPSPSASSTTSSSRSTSAATDDAGSMMDDFGGGNPAQMAQMIQSMSAEELQQMAAMMGITVDQLRDTAQMIGRMPPEQLNQFMMQAMAGGGMDAMMGGGGGAGAGGQHVLRLNEEEMAAVDRLAELGFDRSEAAQAFLACDKNEALAANLLMDSMANGGFFGGDDNNNGGGGGNGADDDDDDDNMYD